MNAAKLNLRDTVGPNQLCSIAGSVAGQNTVTGTAYMQAAFQYRHDHIWRNFGILLAFFAFFMILQMTCIELLAHGGNHLAIVVFKKEDKKQKEMNARLSERKEAYRRGELDQDLSELKMKPQPFTWVREMSFLAIKTLIGL